MKKIKFRAWEENNHKMYDVKEIAWNPDRTLRKVIVFTGVHEVNRALMFNFNHIKLMQFTGLLDKNGKEAWEGDIAKVSYYENRKLKEYIAEIRYIQNEGGFCFWKQYKSGEGWSRMYAGHSTVPWEIIGNIYENGDLLK